MKDLIALYPELERSDGLPLALKDALSKVVPELQYVYGISFSKLREFKDEFEMRGIFHSSSKVTTKNGKWADIDIAIEQKLYLLTLGVSDKEAVGFLEVDSFDMAITFLSVWLGGDSKISQLENVEHCTTFLNLEEDTQYIRWQWASRHRQAVNCGIFTGLLAPLFLEAMHDPVLSQITPYTSHATLFLSRCTEFPFFSQDYPLAAPTYYLGHYHRYVVQRRNYEKAKKLLLELPSDIGIVMEMGNGEYRFTDAYGEHSFRGDSISLLGFIIEYTNERYDVMDRHGNGLVTENAKQAVEFLRNALPSNWYRSIRGSADG